MRALTAAQTLLLGIQTRAHHIKVEVYRTETSGWVDLTALHGYNWLIGATWTESLDAPVANATIKLVHRIHQMTLNPNFTTALPNESGVLLKPYKQLRIYTSTDPFGNSSPADWQLVFRGRIYQVETGRDEITLECRDEGGNLQDLLHEATHKQYGTLAGGTTMQAISQAILDDNSTGVTLYSTLGDGSPAFDTTVTGTQFDPAWSPKTIWTPQPQPILDALSNLWNSIGWDIRFRWQLTMLDYLLVAYKPIRSGAAVDWTFGADDYEVESATRSNVHVRNVIDVYYRNAVKASKIYTATDATSITNNGRKYMRLAEEDSLIDSVTEATILGDAMLADLKEPTQYVTLKVPYFFPIMLNDYVTVTADQVFFSADVTYGVNAITHTFDAGQPATTQLTLAGAPKIVAPLKGTTRHEVKLTTEQRSRLQNMTLNRRAGDGNSNSSLSSYDQKESY